MSKYLSGFYSPNITISPSGKISTITASQFTSGTSVTPSITFSNNESTGFYLYKHGFPGIVGLSGSLIISDNLTVNAPTIINSTYNGVGDNLNLQVSSTNGSNTSSFNVYIQPNSISNSLVAQSAIYWNSDYYSQTIYRDNGTMINYVAFGLAGIDYIMLSKSNYTIGNANISFPTLVSSNTNTLTVVNNSSGSLTNYGLQVQLFNSDFTVYSQNSNITYINNTNGPIVVGSASNQYLSINYTTPSTSISTGALIINGGVGISGDINVGGNIFSNGTQLTLTNITAGSNIFLNKSLTNGIQNYAISVINNPTFSGSVFITNTTNCTTINTGCLVLSGGLSILLDTKIGGNLTSSTISITSTLDSTSSTSGALTVVGGLGVAKSCYIGGSLNIASNLTSSTISITSTLDSTSSTSGALTVIGGLGVAKSCYIGGSLNIASNLTSSTISITSTLDSTSSTSGALTVIGGLGVAKSCYIGGSLNIASNLTSSTILITSTLDSTSSTSGALTVIGGLGVAKSCYIGGSLNVSGILNLVNTSDSTSTMTGTLQTAGGISSQKNIVSNNILQAQQNLIAYEDQTLTNLNTATSGGSGYNYLANNYIQLAASSTLQTGYIYWQQNPGTSVECQFDYYYVSTNANGGISFGFYQTAIPSDCFTNNSGFLLTITNTSLTISTPSQANSTIGTILNNSLSSTLVNNSWNTFNIQYSLGVYKVYVNGMLMGSIDIQHPTSNANALNTYIYILGYNIATSTYYQRIRNIYIKKSLVNFGYVSAYMINSSNYTSNAGNYLKITNGAGNGQLYFRGNEIELAGNCYNKTGVMASFKYNVTTITTNTTLTFNQVVNGRIICNGGLTLTLPTGSGWATWLSANTSFSTAANDVVEFVVYNPSNTGGITFSASKINSTSYGLTPPTCYKVMGIFDSVSNDFRWYI